MIEYIKQLIKDYELGGTITGISLIYNLSRPTIRKILKTSNVYNRRKIEPNFRKYQCDENYFNIIDCPNKAYWLGFIAADGYIQKNNKRLTIELHMKDISHLRKFIKNITRNTTGVSLKNHALADPFHAV